MGKLSPRSSVTLHWDCKQLACLGKNLDNWLGVQDTVGDCQQGRQGEPSAAALEEDSSLLEEDSSLLEEVDSLQVVVDSANSATGQTLGAPEPPTQDDAIPTETPVAVAGLPSVYLMMPRQAEQATHLREAKEIRRSLLAWSRQAIAICSIILVAGVVLTMLAITLIAKDSCKAVKEI